MKAGQAARQQHGAHGGHEVAINPQQRHLGPGKGRVAEYDLTRLSVGIWTTRRSHKMFILNDRKSFVLLAVLSEQDARKRANSRLGRAWQAAQHRLTDKRNPFSLPPQLSAAATAVALEVLWADLQGMDYLNPLHQDGRLVLEARTITKRIFRSVSEARHFYSLPVTSIPSCSAQAAADNRKQGTGTNSDTGINNRQGDHVQPETAPRTERTHRRSAGLPLQRPYARHRLVAHGQAEAGSSLDAATSVQGCLSPANSSPYALSGQMGTPTMHASTAAGNTTLSELQPPAQDSKGQQVALQQQSKPSKDATAQVASLPWHTWATSWVPKLRVTTSMPATAQYNQPQQKSSCSEAPACKASGSSCADANNTAGSTVGTPLAVLSDATRSPSHYASSTQPPGSPCRHAIEASDLSGDSGPCSVYVTPRQSVAGGAGYQQQLDSVPGRLILKPTSGGSLKHHPAPSTPTNTPHASGHAASHALPDTPSNTPHAGVVSPFGKQSAALAALQEPVDQSPDYHLPLADDSCDSGDLYGESAQPDLYLPCPPATANLSSRVEYELTHWLPMSPFMSTPAASACTTPRHRLGPGGRKQRSKSLISLTHNISLLSLASRPAAMGDEQQTSDSHAILDSTRTFANTEATSTEHQQQACGHDVPGIEYGSVIAVFKGYTILTTFRDHMLPPMLSRMVKSDVRILKLYESGLPAWSIFLPSYGLWYRPWLRRVTFLLFTAISIISMAMGFYDLYKNVPIVRQAIAALSQKLVFFNAQAMFEWLEKHAQFRLSILLTYIFSKSPLFVTLMRVLRTGMACITQLASPLLRAAQDALAPVMDFCTSTFVYLLQPLGTLFSMLGLQLLQLGHALAGLGSALLGPPLQAAWLLMVALARAGMSVLQLGKMLLWGPIFVATQAWGSISLLLTQAASNLQWVAAAGRAFCMAIVSGARAVTGILPAAKATGQMVSMAASSSKPAASAVAAAAGSSSSAGWWLFTRASADVAAVLEFMRTSLYRCFRALQAVLNGLLTLALTAIRHRVSLVMQLQRYLLPRKKYLPPAVHHLIQPQPSTPFPTAASSDLSVSLKLQDYPEHASMDDTASSPALSPAGVSRPGLRQRKTAVNRRVSLHEDGRGRYAPYARGGALHGPRHHGGIPLHPATKAQSRAKGDAEKQVGRPSRQQGVGGARMQLEGMFANLDYGEPAQDAASSTQQDVVNIGQASGHCLPAVRVIRCSHSSPGLLCAEDGPDGGEQTAMPDGHDMPMSLIADELETYATAHELGDDLLALCTADEPHALAGTASHALQQQMCSTGLHSEL